MVDAGRGKGGWVQRESKRVDGEAPELMKKRKMVALNFHPPRFITAACPSAQKGAGSA